MKKIICIGECSMNLVLDSAGKPLGSLPGGRIANAAAILGRNGYNVAMASEAAADSIGDIIVGNFAAAGVDVKSVDRFTEGQTPLNIFVQSSGPQNILPRLTRYETYPDEAFDIIWPRIDDSDIIVFGGYYTIDSRMRQRMQRLLTYASERKALMIYLPGFLQRQEPRITHIMPQILENLEMADVVVTRNKELEFIFGVKIPDACYRDHIDFYCRSLVNIDDACNRTCYYTGKEMSSVDIPAGKCHSLQWNSGALAGIVAEFFNRGTKPAELESPSQELREAVLANALKYALTATQPLTEPWQLIE